MFSKLVPVTRDLIDKGFVRNTSFLFAKSETMCELVYDELSDAIMAFPVAMVRIDGVPKLVALLSVLPNQNCFVSPDGRFLASYVPRILRQYPFTLYPTKEGKRILCVDESALAPKEQANVQAFYDENGEPTEFLTKFVQMWEQFRGQQIDTDNAMRALDDAGVFSEWELVLEYSDGTQTRIGDVYRINEEKMRALSPDVCQSLIKSGALGIAYAQILSHNKITALKKIVSEHAKYLAEKEKLLAVPAASPAAASAAGSSKQEFDWGF